MKFIKEQLPWIASTAALTFVGIGYLNNGVLPFGTNTQPAEAPTQDVAVTDEWMAKHEHRLRTHDGNVPEFTPAE